MFQIVLKASLGVTVKLSQVISGSFPNGVLLKQKQPNKKKLSESLKQLYISMHSPFYI